VILDQTALENEPLWKTEPVITLGNSVKLVVEVVSTNWQNDYARKVEDYEALGIPEYWIADYLGLGGKRYIGSSKQPVTTIYQLVDGTYQGQQFRGKERLVSPTFPDLNLTAEQIFAAGRLWITIQNSKLNAIARRKTPCNTVLLREETR
jgi:Uma2 family endonuclease